MGNPINQHSNPNPNRESKKAKEKNHPVPPSEKTELMAVRAERALNIIEFMHGNPDRFIHNWIGFNALYNAYDGDERTRLMTCIKEGITNGEAVIILELVRDELHYYARTPPGDMRYLITDPRFRRRATVDLQMAIEGKTPVERLAHLMAAVYQVRCNLFHGAKAPHIQRNRELIEKGNAILEKVIATLVEKY